MELSGGGGKNREREMVHGELDIYIGNDRGNNAGRRASSRLKMTMGTNPLGLINPNPYPRT
jgi:hypothetical protein